MNYCLSNSDKCEVQGRRSGNGITRHICAMKILTGTHVLGYFVPQVALHLTLRKGNKLSLCCFEIQGDKAGWLLQKMVDES